MNHKELVVELLRCAAENIAVHIETVKPLHMSYGMCAAINAAYGKLRSELPPRSRKNDIWDAWMRAREIVHETYRHDSPFVNRLFWMGSTIDTKCQKHRIVALLMLADAIESGDFNDTSSRRRRGTRRVR